MLHIMHKIKYLIIIFIFIIIINLFYSIAYCNDGIEVNEPVSNSDNSISEAIIYAPNNQYRYDPLHTETVGMNDDEYAIANTYTIDIKTLRYRIKYFAPEYLNDKNTEILTVKINENQKGNKKTEYIDTYGINNIDESNRTLSEKLDDMEEKAINLILEYLEIKYNKENYENESVLYEKMYKFYDEECKNGLIDAVTVSKKMLEYKTCRNNVNTYTNKLKTKLHEIASFLGYKITDTSMINIIEPNVDFDLDFINKYNEYLEEYIPYDTEYLSVRNNGVEGEHSTSDSYSIVLYNKKLEQAKLKANLNFNKIYYELYSSMLKYNGTNYLWKIIKLKTEENEEKYKYDLIAETEYLNNKIEIQNNKNEINQLKYNLLKNYYKFFYCMK